MDYIYPTSVREAIHQVAFGATSYLEVGVNNGDSLRVALIEAPTINRIALVDMWGVEWGGDGKGSGDHIVEVLNEVGYRGDVEVWNGNSHDILPELIQREHQFDLVTIDGDHSEEGGRQDLHDGWNLVRPGGWLVFDDIYHPAHAYLMSVVNEFEEQMRPRETIWITDLGNGAVAFRK